MEGVKPETQHLIMVHICRPNLEYNTLSSILAGEMFFNKAYESWTISLKQPYWTFAIAIALLEAGESHDNAQSVNPLQKLVDYLGNGSETETFLDQSRSTLPHSQLRGHFQFSYEFVYF